MELAYQRAAEKAVQEENCFKIYIYKRDCRVTIELLDTEPEDSKKVDEAKKWSNYKECYANIGNTETKPRSPVYLDRNLRLYHRLAANNVKKRVVRNHQLNSEEEDKNKRLQEDGPVDKNEDFNLLDAILKERDRTPPERNHTDHPGYEVSDETQCKFNIQNTKIMFTVTKDSYLYNISAFHKARMVSCQICLILSQYLKI